MSEENRLTPVFSVTELTRNLKLTLESGFGDVWVEGELSNVKHHTSGHCYFCLKDAGAQLQGVMWRSRVAYLEFVPEDGRQVRVHGRITIYEPRGQYQIVADEMQPAGLGALLQAFEQLKRRLDAEGLFDPARKRAIPRIPRTIGVVTSRDGAALRDILSILSRRYPLVEVYLAPVPVQGAAASGRIARVIDGLNAASGTTIPILDVLIVGRGGGSLEDLWAFNEEVVARAIYRSRIPVISAVGHETDFTIADFVADVRAATPSMAAELAVPDRDELSAYLRRSRLVLQQRMLATLRDRRLRIRVLVHSHVFRRPVNQLERYLQRTDDLVSRIDTAMGRILERRRHRLAVTRTRLDSLNPEGPLSRGYALVESNGEHVGRAAALTCDQPINIRFVDGTRSAVVTR